MSNRLRPEQFGSSKKVKENYKPMRLDDVMQKSLAGVCKQWLDDGRDKEWVLQWMNDRFDLHGKLNLRSVCTDIEMENKETGDLNDEMFSFQNGQVFSLDSTACATFTMAITNLLKSEDHSEYQLGMHHETLVNFMLELTGGYKHYVIWRCCYQTEDTSETMIFGCLLTDISMESAPQQTTGAPYPTVGSVLELLVKAGVLKYTGDFVG